MEVLTPYLHHQLGPNLNADVASLDHFGVESSKACGKEVSYKHRASFPSEGVLKGGQPVPENAGGIDRELEEGQEKEERNSDTVDASVLTCSLKSSKKEKEQAQIEYLLSSLPIINKLFKVHGKIGEGTFSSVFLASLKDAPSGSSLARRQFAVKHLIPTTHPSRAERELKCLQEIGGSDNVVGVDLCVRNQDSIAFVMPYLPHRRFHEYVMDMGVMETRNYMKHLLLALQRVHSFNIIHRDVKPSNFLYDRETKLFLLVDFGLSQPVEETSKMGSVNSSPFIESRKRKREKEHSEDYKTGFLQETVENPTKRSALALNNSTNIIKTPEKQPKGPAELNFVCKPLPQSSSSRAKRLQNITNKNSGSVNPHRTPSNTMGITLNSPAKEIIDSSHGRKTPRKNKIHHNTENISPLKYESQIYTKKSSHCEGNEIWKEKNYQSSEKYALDLRKAKVDVEASGQVSQMGPRSSLQRKILFDDVPDGSSKTAEKIPPRFSVTPSSTRNSLGHASNSPAGLSMLSKTVLNSSVSTMNASYDSLSLSPIDQSGSLGREFRTLAPDYSKDDVAGSSIVRVQNSQVKSQQLSPVTPSETRMLRIPNNLPSNGKLTDNKDAKIFAKPHAPNAGGSLHRTNTPSSPLCNCAGRPQVCTVCLSRKAYNAPRAGTPGFRPPEVLLRSPIQSTAVDMWAVGVILLCILSGCYPFFRSPDDLTALAEIMTVFGTDKIKETAKRLGRMVVCSQPSQPLDLKKLCTRMRQRRKDKNISGSTPTDSIGERCQNCCQPLGKSDSCVCLKNSTDSHLINPMDVNNTSDSDDIFPDTAYHLLARLLDLDADTRITAAEALNHPFVIG